MKEESNAMKENVKMKNNEQKCVKKKNNKNYKMKINETFK
jgi:hypothetical protein